MIITIQQILYGATIIGIPALRAFAGWAYNALEDKVITMFEVEQLISTEFRIIIGGVFTYLGLNAFGLNIDMVSSVLSVAMIDWFRTLFKPKTLPTPGTIA